MLTSEALGTVELLFTMKRLSEQVKPKTCCTSSTLLCRDTAIELCYRSFLCIMHSHSIYNYPEAKFANTVPGQKSAFWDSPGYIASLSCLENFLLKLYLGPKWDSFYRRLCLSFLWNHSTAVPVLKIKIISQPINCTQSKQVYIASLDGKTVKRKKEKTCSSLSTLTLYHNILTDAERIF